MFVRIRDFLYSWKAPVDGFSAVSPRRTSGRVSYRSWLMLSLLAVSLHPGMALAMEDVPASPAPRLVNRWLDSVVLLVTGPSWCGGVVVDEQGLVATAYHCVANGARPTIRTRDGTRVGGEVVAWSARNDLALVSAPDLAGKLEPRPIRISAPVPGEPTWAMGHPFAPLADTRPSMRGLLQWSVSTGVVSAVGERFIQVDAALNPGCSGGPLLDLGGRIIGIASRKYSADNVAFAATAKNLSQLLGQLGKRALGGYWGVGLTSVVGLENDLGLVLFGSLRDRLTARLAWHLPLSAQWSAFQQGESTWVAGEAIVGVRQALGTGTWTSRMDLGGGALLLGGMTVSIVGENVELHSLEPVLVPVAEARFALSGVGVRILWSPNLSTILLGADLELPGVLGVF